MKGQKRKLERQEEVSASGHCLAPVVPNRLSSLRQELCFIYLSIPNCLIHSNADYKLTFCVTMKIEF